MKINYIVYEDFFSERASNMQIVNTSNSLFKEGFDINLVFPYYFEMPERYKVLSKVNFLSPKQFDKFSKINILKFSFKLFYFLKRQGSDQLVYFRHLLLLPAMLVIKLFLPKINIVYEVHRQVNDVFGRYCEKQLIKKGARLITISQSLKNIYLSRYQYLSSEDVCVVHDAVDLEKFDINISLEEAKRLSGISLDKPAIMYIGSLWIVKGVNILLESAKMLSDYNFYFIGKEHEDFKFLKEQYSSLENVFILEPVEHEKVAILQKAADLLVIPHPKNNLSQSPMKLFEYLASSRPILAADLGNLKEILPTDAMFFKAEDSNDLASKIKDYFNSQEKYLSLAKKNVEIARKYSWPNRSKLIKDFINK